MSLCPGDRGVQDLAFAEVNAAGDAGGIGQPENPGLAVQAEELEQIADRQVTRVAGQRGVLRLRPRGRPFGLDDAPFHARQQLLPRERLGDVIIRPHPEPLHPARHLPHGGEEQERDLGGLGPGPDRLAELPPVHDRHDDVRDDHVRPLVARLLQSLLAVSCQDDLEAGGVEEVPDHALHQEAVVHHQDAMPGRGGIAAHLSPSARQRAGRGPEGTTRGVAATAPLPPGRP